MATPTVPTIEPVIHEGVLEVLQKHDCVAEFWERVALARECVPEMRSLEVMLVHDPDEDGWTWIELTAIVPVSITWEQCRALGNNYITQAVRCGYPTRLFVSFVLHVRPESE